MKPYNDYSTHLREKYGSKVYRIGIDAAFSCPFRCTYCNENGSRSTYSTAGESVEKQISERIEYLKKSRSASRFIAYFQAFTNTNASPDKLKYVYDQILPFKDIVGLSIGTRPDCIDGEKLNLIASYKDTYEVWLEYGLQTIHDRTLKNINRGHEFKDFLNAYNLTKRLSIPVCAHVIIGLPGENRKDILETAEKLTELQVDGIKIHLLHILKGSVLEKQYRDGAIHPLGQEEYVEIVCDFLERLSPGIIIQRMTAQGSKGDHIAPAWALDKLGTLQMIVETLKRRGSYQGRDLPLSSNIKTKSSSHP